MPAANILINGVASSNDALPINTVVLLNNANVGGETTFLWEVLDQPEGTADALTSSSVQNPSFTPKKEGSYLLRLTVNQGQGNQVVNTRVAAVRQLKSHERVPSAFEIFEVDTAKGWKTAANRLLNRVDSVVSDANLLVCADASATPPLVGDVVTFSQVATIKSGLPGQETIPVVQQAQATSSTAMRSPLGVVVRTVTGGATGAGVLVVVRRVGLAELSVSTGSPSLGDLVWVSDANRPSLTPGTNPRVIGRVVDFDGTAWRYFIDGSMILTARTEQFSALGNATVIANWTPNLGGYMLSTGSGDLVVGVPSRVGDTLAALTFSRFGGGTGTLTATINKIAANGTLTGGGSVTVTNPAASWTDSSVSITGGTLAAGDALFVDFNASVSGIRVGTVRPTFLPNP